MKKILTVLLLLALCVTCALAENVTFEPHWDFDADTYGKEGCAMAVSFCSEDVADGCLSYDIYAPDLYDAESLKAMKVGDSIFANDKLTEITALTVEQECLYTINGGFDEGGVTLAYIDGDWDNLYSIQYNDFVNYTLVGEACFPFADEVTICSYHWLADGQPADEMDEVKVPAADVQAYLAKLETEQHIDFDYSDTMLIVEDGKIIDITVVWTPAA